VSVTKMTNISGCLRKFVAMTLVASSVVSVAGTAWAMPFADGAAMQNAAPANVEQVRWGGGGWGGHGWGGRGWGWGAGAGFVAGALLGGALVGPRYYGPGPYYYGPGPYYAPGPYYGAPGPYYSDPGAAPTGGDPVAYCLSRFKSYDPRSGTYLGYDGLRHPCP
jgi:hypothetical protein